MKTNKSIFALAAFSSVLLFSCKKEKTGNPSVAYNLKSTNTSSPVARVAGGSISWSAAYANVTEIRFETENNAVEIEYTSEARKKVDLLSTQSTLGNVQVPAGVYSRAEFEIELSGTATESALELQGSFNGTPVLFKVGGNYEIETERENITIVDGKDYTSVTALNFSLLTQGVTEAMLSNATLTNGTIVISSSSNSDIYEKMVLNLHTLDGVELQ